MTNAINDIKKICVIIQPINYVTLNWKIGHCAINTKKGYNAINEKNKGI